MRTSIAIALVVAFIQTAAAQDKPVVPDTDGAAGARKELTIQLMQKQLEAAGLTDVHISPQVHVVQAKDKDGKPVVLVVDPQTMVAIPLIGGPSTTGSGSEGDERL